ncbi:MAG TPA: DUF5069 domain-containing protein [Opitutaceae bacterium]|nr:DUF5069 domain-containing protein [Opitutaceae bacterium]
MKNYDFASKFHSHYDQAVARFADGKRGADGFFNADELAFLAENGITAQHLYDYAEDHNNYDEPGFDIALGIELVRRDYFVNVQGRRPSTTKLDETKLPSKTDSVRGIAWLPRLLPKAKAKLRGELPPSLMFCCGGDRAFFKQHDIQPAEFLGVLWRSNGDDAVVIDWVSSRTAGK